MKLTVNGSDVEHNNGLTVSELLVEHEVKMPEMVSVEVNGQILRSNDFSEKSLKEGDSVEFIYFMGGGCGIN